MIKKIIGVGEAIALKGLKISTERRHEVYVKLFLLLLATAIMYNYRESLNSVSNTLLDLFVAFLAIDFAVLFLRVIIVSLYRKKNKLGDNTKNNFTIGMDRISILVLYLCFLVFIIIYSGVDIIRFFTTLGLFSVAIAWIFKEKISNIIDGLSIMFSNDIRLKDYISIKDYTGIVLDVNFSNTKLKTDDGDIVYVPNMILLNNEVTNFSKSQSKRIKYDFMIDTKNFSKFGKIEKSLTKKIEKKFEDVIEEDSITFKINNIKRNAIDVTVFIEMTKYNFTIDSHIKKFISLELIKMLSKNK